MTDPAAIRKLIEAVEAGGTGWNRLATIAEDAVPPKEAALAATANSGSMDAALAFMKAVLPGWDWGIYNGPERKKSANVWKNILHPFDGTDADPARALLLACLRAMEASNER